MAGVAYGFAFLLAFVFVRASVAKLYRRTETAAAFTTMGLPAAGVLSRIVPAVELALAVALIAAPPWGALASIALLAAFTALLVRLIATGSDAGCNCFGSAHAEPVTTADLVRNGALVSMALVVVVVLWP